MSYSGVFSPKHVEKYLGDAKRVFYRSLWEKRFMRYCDETPGVLKWAFRGILHSLFVSGRPPSTSILPRFLFRGAGYRRYQKICD